MTITATEKQIKRMAANAVNASTSMGMGFLHYDSQHEFRPEDFELTIDGLHLDYVQGRMVKLHIVRSNNGTWRLPDGNPCLDYQSWCAKYPTYSDLVDSAAIRGRRER